MVKKNGLLTIGVAITALVIIKGAIAFAASLPIGGLSLILLFIYLFRRDLNDL